MTSPTTHLDAIGLSDRLRDRDAIVIGGMFTAIPLLHEAATALDALLKERDALQARVKELEARQADDLAEFGLMEMRALRAEQERADEWNLRREAESQRDVAKAAADTLRQERDEAYERLKTLAEARALSGVRKLVAGWNGEGREDGPYTRHPDELGATLPKTNCGAIYQLDDAMTAARDLVRRLAGPEKEGK